MPDKDKKYVLFLHGWGGSIQSFLAYEKLLKEDFVCINLDFPPFGKSEESKEEWTLEDYTNMVLLLLDFLGVEKVHIIAHSFGARVALMLAASTVRVNKLIITGGAGIRPRKTFKRYFRTLRYKFAKLFVKLKLRKKDSLKRYFSSDYQKLSYVMQKTFKNIVNLNLKNVLEYVSIPTLLIWGGGDTETPLYMAKIMHSKIKDSGLIVYNGGHFCYIERFKEVFAACRHFLTEGN